MKMLKKLSLIAFAILMLSCSGDKKGKEIDWISLKKDIQLDPSKEKQFDEIIAKYTRIQEDNYNAAQGQGKKMNRTALLTKQEEARAQQALEMEKVLDAPQMEKFNKFVDENSRKRPRYNDALLQKIKTEAQLSEEEFAVVNAANDAFEKAFNDAHDVYHGNDDLAKEYWDKFNEQRKAAIQKALTPEHYTKFEELIKEVELKEKE
ncbi:hypothetical protein ACM46_01075 [Chryseobacterium angstadtii]|uniref:Lipoprotein n=1 Tax=Chryseobacterium angstadtii TaxID=558151 RepID=A0A0J7IJM3_9FLAO|nr:hypothetical protein [Chryseobacterium angstadtii]KMQ66186.1 hypothetical protein ACM46_01075 [Chryseobacterium angstadtii]